MTSQLKDASKKYKVYFSFANELSGNTLKECNDPSLFELYLRSKEKEVPSTLDSVEIYRYISKLNWKNQIIKIT